MHSLASVDTMETQQWAPSESHQLTPSPVRHLDFGSPQPADVLKRAVPLEKADVSSGESSDEESAEEESSVEDEMVEPITNHLPEIISIDSDDDQALLSPKKIGPTEPLTDQPNAASASSAEPQQNMAEKISSPLPDDTLLPETLEMQSQVFNEVQTLADSDDEQEKRGSGTFKASI